MNIVKQWIYNYVRTVSYIPILGILFLFFPKSVIVGYATYYFIISHFQFYQNFLTNHFLHWNKIHDNIDIINAGFVREKDKNYIFSTHPHGLIGEVSFETLFDSRLQKKAIAVTGISKVVAALGPLLQFLPLFREKILAHKRDPINNVFTVGACNSKVIKEHWEKGYDIIIYPGGFSESIYSDRRDKFEYSYFLDRKPFIAMTIKNKYNVAPIYVFGATDFYEQMSYFRNFRAKWTQKLKIPMVYFWGKYHSAIRFSKPEKCGFVVGPSINMSKYSLDQIDEAHLEYMKALQKLYDTHKHEYGMGHKSLVFVGHNKRMQLDGSTTNLEGA
jgi:hypothetical protein